MFNSIKKQLSDLVNEVAAIKHMVGKIAAICEAESAQAEAERKEEEARIAQLKKALAAEFEKRKSEIAKRKDAAAQRLAEEIAKRSEAAKGIRVDYTQLVQYDIAKHSRINYFGKAYGLAIRELLFAIDSAGVLTFRAVFPDGRARWCIDRADVNKVTSFLKKKYDGKNRKSSATAAVADSAGNEAAPQGAAE